MKKNANSEIDKILFDNPGYLVNLIKGSVDTDNVSKKLSSRKTLVKMGRKILPVMNKLLKSGDILIRMEAAKIIELIGDRMSIPVLIDLLDDNEFDIRWIASEGLIKIGRRSIRPVLKSVRDGENSILLNEGAHHVLTALLSESEKKKEMQLLQSLENHHSLGATAPIEASLALGPVIYKNKLL
jgi:HEAT repeat protein